MGWFQRIFGRASAASDATPDPFMEHPTGEFETCVAAMEDAVRRLRSLPSWEQWITFSAQGEGHAPDSCECAEVRMLHDHIDVGDSPVDVPRIVEAAGTTASSLVADGGYLSVANASPGEVARILDALFRHHFGLRPFEDENDDYAVGAEW